MFGGIEHLTVLINATCVSEAVTDIKPWDIKISRYFKPIARGFKYFIPMGW